MLSKVLKHIPILAPARAAWGATSPKAVRNFELGEEWSDIYIYSHSWYGQEDEAPPWQGEKEVKC